MTFTMRQDRPTQSGNGEKMKRLLYGTPIVFRNQDGIGATAGDLDGLVTF